MRRLTPIIQTAMSIEYVVESTQRSRFYLTCTIIFCFGKTKYFLVLTGQKIIQNKIFFGFCFGFAKAKNNCAGQVLAKAKLFVLTGQNTIAKQKNVLLLALVLSKTKTKHKIVQVKFLQMTPCRDSNRRALAIQRTATKVSWNKHDAQVRSRINRAL